MLNWVYNFQVPDLKLSELDLYILSLASFGMLIPLCDLAYAVQDAKESNKKLEVGRNLSFYLYYEIVHAFIHIKRLNMTIHVPWTISKILNGLSLLQGIFLIHILVNFPPGNLIENISYNFRHLLVLPRVRGQRVTDIFFWKVRDAEFNIYIFVNPIDSTSLFVSVAYWLMKA